MNPWERYEAEYVKLDPEAKKLLLDLLDIAEKELEVALPLENDIPYGIPYWLVTEADEPLIVEK